MPLCGPIVPAETFKCGNKGMWAKVWFTESSQTLRSDVIYCLTNKPSMFITSGSCPPMKIWKGTPTPQMLNCYQNLPPACFICSRLWPAWQLSHNHFTKKNFHSLWCMSSVPMSAHVMTRSLSPTSTWVDIFRFTFHECYLALALTDQNLLTL
jgi:hypothetical protein